MNQPKDVKYEYRDLYIGKTKDIWYVIDDLSENDPRVFGLSAKTLNKLYKDIDKILDTKRKGGL